MPETIAASGKATMPVDRKQRVHFTAAHDVLLLQAVEAQGAHLHSTYGTMEGKWAAVTRDVINAVRKKLGDPSWTVST